MNNRNIISIFHVLKQIVLLLLALLMIYLGYSVKNKKLKEIARFKKVVIGIHFHDIGYAPYYVAKSKGWFEENLKNENIEKCRF